MVAIQVQGRFTLSLEPTQALVQLDHIASDVADETPPTVKVVGSLRYAEAWGLLLVEGAAALAGPVQPDAFGAQIVCDRVSLSDPEEVYVFVHCLSY
jgi:hypothetical protein